jgi:hypothetical protein
MKNASKTSTFVTFALSCLLTSTIALGQDSESLAQVAENPDVSPLAPPGLITIYSNLNTVMPTYDYTKGYFVAGPASTPKQHWLAMPFTPAANSHVTEIEVAMQWFSKGPNDVTIKIASGATVPTTLVPGSTRTLSTLPTFTKLDCCPLPTVHYPNPGIALTKGTQYWIVATTNSASTATEDIWCLVWNDAIGTFAYNHGQGWILKADQNPALAFAVLGTTP